MDKYLTMFTDQIDKEFNPDIVFPEKEFYIIGWLNRKFIIRKNRKKQVEENSTANNTAEAEYVSLTVS